jgi:hypothetical protein
MIMLDDLSELVRRVEAVGVKYAESVGAVKELKNNSKSGGDVTLWRKPWSCCQVKRRGKSRRRTNT